MTKPRPWPRNSSTACCMRWAAVGSSQVPKASVRSLGAPGTMMPVSPRISGASSPAADQAMSTCGSDSSSALSRSISALSAIASSRARILDALGAAAGAHQHDGREHGKADEAERQRQPGDVLPVDIRQRAKEVEHAGAGRRGHRHQR